MNRKFGKSDADTPHYVFPPIFRPSSKSSKSSKS